MNEQLISEICEQVESAQKIFSASFYSHVRDAKTGKERQVAETFYIYSTVLEKVAELLNLIAPEKHEPPLSFEWIDTVRNILNDDHEEEYDDDDYTPFEPINCVLDTPSEPFDYISLGMGV